MRYENVKGQSLMMINEREKKKSTWTPYPFPSKAGYQSRLGATSRVVRPSEPERPVAPVRRVASLLPKDGVCISATGASARVQLVCAKLHAVRLTAVLWTAPDLSVEAARTCQRRRRAMVVLRPAASATPPTHTSVRPQRRRPPGGRRGRARTPGSRPSRDRNGL
jgi:hypothetical protein